MGSYDGPSLGFGKYNGEIVYFDSDTIPDKFFLPIKKEDVHNKKLNDEFADYKRDYEFLGKHYKELLDYIENNIWCDNFDIDVYIQDECTESTDDNYKVIQFKNFDIEILNGSYSEGDHTFMYDYILIFYLRNYDIFRITDTLKENIENINQKNLNKQNDVLEKISVVCSRNVKYNYRKISL